MKLIDFLFVIGSLFAFIAGLTEIKATRNRWNNGEKQNPSTSLFMTLVKLTRLPKFISMADGTLSNSFPMISCMGAAVIWGISLVYTLLPVHHYLPSI